MRPRDLTGNRAERFVKAVLVLKTLLENLHHDDLAFEFPVQNASRFRKPLVTTWFAPSASECRLQDLLRGAHQMLRRLDPQVRVLGQRQCLPPRLIRKLPISQSL